MKIKRIKIKNYRSIKSEVAVDFSGELILIGPNNSGKTNFLRAIKLFFNGLSDGKYSITNDLPFGVTGEQTSIVISFSPSSPYDDKFLARYQEVIDLLEGEKQLPNELINLYLSFTSSGRANYRFFTNDKVKSDKREEYRRLHEELIASFLDGFICKYIPSEKSSAQLFSDFLLPHLKKYIGDLLQDHAQKVTEALSIVSSEVAHNMRNAGLDGITCEFGLPENLFSGALSKFDFFIDDGEKTPFFNKGSGIQAATILACLQWITNQEKSTGKQVIWLIEEPESYLHPGLTGTCNKILQNLSTLSDVFVTTHAIGFVPKNHEKVLQSTIDRTQGTSFRKLKGYAEATKSIRTALGIRFSDYYNLSDYNIFVEGKTDKILIQHVLNTIKPKGKANHYKTLRQAVIMDFSGVSSLKEFLKATYSFMAKERSIVSVFDGDEAGLRAVKDLGNYFGNKDTPFHSNSEFIVLPGRAPIEALFPHAWLIEFSNQNPKLMRIENDAFGEIVSIDMPGNNKMEICNWLIDRSNRATEEANGVYEWAKKFIVVFNILEEILERKHQIITKTQYT